MFTGIIEAQGIVTRAERKGGGLELEIFVPAFGRELNVGESVSVDGVCLTVENFLRGAFLTSLTAETLERSTLGKYHPSTKVNLERAMTGGNRFGGHFVTGHVDAVGSIVTRRPVGGGTEVTISAPEEVRPYLLEKGSVAVDGISLTVTGVGRDTFSTVIIPHTELATTLDGKAVGEAVNLEADMMAKYVRRYVREVLAIELGDRKPAKEAFAGWAEGVD